MTSKWAIIHAQNLLFLIQYGFSQKVTRAFLLAETLEKTFIIKQFSSYIEKLQHYWLDTVVNRACPSLNRSSLKITKVPLIQLQIVIQISSFLCNYVVFYSLGIFKINIFVLFLHLVLQNHESQAFTWRHWSYLEKSGFSR